MNDFLTSWAHHWGWLWMAIGLVGNVVIVVLLDD
jgi:hypothetical protein